MQKFNYIIILLLFTMMAAASTSPAAAPDGDRSITLVYSGDLHGNIRPVYE